MTYPIDKEVFVKRWCEAKGEADESDREFAEALVNCINKAYKRGVEDGKRSCK
ncbi:MAG: hypothetical protein IJZ53_11070 [Tyzzerella sp.]|nr:hypothetical protein [Tyzzerella sp.]